MCSRQLKYTTVAQSANSCLSYCPCFLSVTFLFQSPFYKFRENLHRIIFIQHTSYVHLFFKHLHSYIHFREKSLAKCLSIYRFHKSFSEFAAVLVVKSSWMFVQTSCSQSYYKNPQKKVTFSLIYYSDFICTLTKSS